MCHGVAPESATCGTLGVDAESVDLARDRHHCRESESGRSEPSKSWLTGAGHSSDRLGGSAWQGTALCDLEAPVPLGATRGRTVCWFSQARQAVGCELEPTFLSRATICSRRDDNTSVVRGGDDEDDPTCRSNPLLPPPRWLRRRSTTVPATDLHWRRRHAPPFSTS
jgi:hypothetical protein